MIRADMLIAALPMAPSNSPNSKALPAPRAWALVPRARPFAVLLLIPIRFIKVGAARSENNPEITTKSTVNEGTPPNVLEMERAMGIVTDFGIKE